MRNIKLIIEYDGKNFAGWQKQPMIESVQEEIERAIYLVTGEKTEIIGSGRTDAGVHALRAGCKFSHKFKNRNRKNTVCTKFKT